MPHDHISSCWKIDLLRPTLTWPLLSTIPWALQYLAVAILRPSRKKKSINNALFGLSRRHCKKVIFDLWPQFALPRDLDFQKKLHASESSRQGLSNAVCRLSLRCVVLEISGGKMPTHPNGARWSADPNGARVKPKFYLKLIKKYIFSEGEHVIKCN